MRIKPFVPIRSLLVLVTLFLTQAAWSAAPPDYYDLSDGESTQDSRFSIEELEELVAPIALYPDPLIAQLLPAATFADQIGVAARYLREHGSQARIDSQYWDVSVKALAHYPDLLFMMEARIDWTVALGQAYLNQPDDLMAAIQYLRQDAREAGNLISTPQQQVVVANGYIRILPAVPELIYVPVYDPQVVYVEPPPSAGFITFGLGFTIGAWLNRDCDWHGRRIYYHGWKGHGWVARSRHHVHTRNSIYVTGSNRVISTNRRLIERDNRQFRQQTRSDAAARRRTHPFRAWPPSERGRSPRVQPPGNKTAPDRHSRDPWRPTGHERFRDASPGETIAPGGEVRPRRPVPTTDRRHRREGNRPESGDGVTQQPGRRDRDRPGENRGLRGRDNRSPATPDSSRQPRTRVYRGVEEVDATSPSRMPGTAAGREGASRRDQGGSHPVSRQPGSGRTSGRDSSAPPHPRPATESRPPAPAGGRGEASSPGTVQPSSPHPAATGHRRGR